MVEERGGGVEAATQGLHLCEAAPPLQTWRLHMRKIETYQLPFSAHVQIRNSSSAFLCACAE
jgi:hypothetical protein